MQLQLRWVWAIGMAISALPQYTSLSQCPCLLLCEYSPLHIKKQHYPHHIHITKSISLREAAPVYVRYGRQDTAGDTSTNTPARAAQRNGTSSTRCCSSQARSRGEERSRGASERRGEGADVTPHEQRGAEHVPPAFRVAAAQNSHGHGHGHGHGLGPAPRNPGPGPGLQ